MRLDSRTRVALPSFPFGPGREPYSRRARRLLGLALAAIVVLAAVVGAVLARSPVGAPLRVVTIPAADRAASASLLRSAEAVGFEPRSEAGTGVVEQSRLVAADPRSATGLLPAGSRAPRFVLRTPTGEAVSLASLRGKAVLLEFFATWCPHCDAEAPHLAALARALPAGRYGFVSVDADGETAPSVLAFHIYFGLPYPALLDPGGARGSFDSPGSAGRVSSAYRVRSLPTFYVLDAAGRIVWAGEGEQPDLLLRQELRRAASDA